MQIDLFHDTACPWCRIGKRHLQLALAQWEGEPAQVRYRTFFLNERIPPAGEDFKPYMNAKVGGRIPLEQMFAGPRCPARLAVERRGDGAGSGRRGLGAAGRYQRRPLLHRRQQVRLERCAAA